MKKNTKLIIACAACVAVLSAGLAVAVNLPSEKEETEKTNNSDTILLFDKTDVDVDEITVTNESGTYELLGYKYSESLNDESSAESSAASAESSEESSEISTDPKDSEVEIIYTMQDYPEEHLEKSLTDNIVNQCNYMAAERIVDKSGKKYAEYGLDKPLITVTVTFSDNSTEKMYIGNEAPDNKGVYLRLDGNQNVYLVQASMVNTFAYEKMQLFDHSISPSYDDNYKITSVDLSGKKFGNEISISNEQNGITNSGYIMYQPYREIVNSTFVSDYGESLFGIDGTKVEAVRVTDKELKKYGLDEPYMEIKVTSEDATEINVIVSEADKDGKFYIAGKGETKIFSMNTDRVDWYDVSYADFLDDMIINPLHDTLVSAEISCNGQDYLYTYEHTTAVNKKYEETEIISAIYNGKAIDISNLQLFINNLKGIRRNLSAPKSLDGCKEVFSMTFTFDIDGEKATDNIKLYTSSDNQYIIVLNGHIEAYTDSEYAKELIKQVPLIPSTERIENINPQGTEEEASDSSPATE